MSCILIVEDNYATRTALSTLLRDEGYPVECAANGQEALLRMNGGLSPCLILLDLVMPCMDGWQFCEELARDPKRAAIPFVLLSGVHEVGESKLGRAAVAVFPKPVDFDALLATVARYCESAAPAA